jgi:hypothetical protein
VRAGVEVEVVEVVDGVDGVAASLAGRAVAKSLTVDEGLESAVEASCRFTSIRPWLSYAISALRSCSRRALGLKRFGMIMAGDRGR